MACAVALAIIANSIICIALFAVQEKSYKWRGNPLGIYAFAISMQFLAALLMCGVYLMGIKKGKKGAYEGNGDIALDTAEGGCCR